MTGYAYSWPQTCLYGSLGKTIPHAIGVISINWLFVESVQEQLLHHYMGVELDQARLQTTRLSNDRRSDQLRRFAESAEPDSSFREAIERFVRCFDAAKHNRNLIMHSISFPSPEGAMLVSRRIEGRVRICDLATDDSVLERVGLEMRNLFHFGMTLWECLRVRATGSRVKLPALIETPRLLEPVERSPVH